jgi:hypothetical protein
MGGSPALCRVHRVAPAIWHRAGAAQRGPVDAAADDRRESAEELVAVAPRRAARVTQPPQRCSGRGNPMACGEPEHARLHRRRRATDGLGRFRTAAPRLNATPARFGSNSLNDALHCTARASPARPTPSQAYTLWYRTCACHTTNSGRTTDTWRGDPVRAHRRLPMGARRTRVCFGVCVRACACVCVCVCVCVGGWLRAWLCCAQVRHRAGRVKQVSVAARAQDRS